MDRRRAAAPVVPHKKPIAASYAEAPQRVLAFIVVDVQPAVVRVYGQGRPVAERIVHRSTNRALGQDLGRLGFQPCMEAVQERPRPLLPLGGDLRGTLLQREFLPIALTALPEFLLDRVELADPS